MLPVIALVGRPNVGKSTLFNCLTRTRDALVAAIPGLTRDRQYGVGKTGPHPCLVIDTGGLTGEASGLHPLIAQQVERAIAEADAILFLVDGRAGLSAADQDIAGDLRALAKPLYVVVNKTEHMDSDVVTADFYALGLGEPHAISAAHNLGVAALMAKVLAGLPFEEVEQQPPEAEGIRLAVVGRPNVGKSTLVNRLLGEERMLTFDQPGTTRDSVAIPFEKEGRAYTLIDTAGVRRRRRVSEVIEKFSVIKTLQAIEQAHVVIMLLDARQGIADQDATLLGFILDRGRPLVLAVNKWDRLEPEVRRRVRRELERKLTFLDFARIHFISALHGSGVVEVLHSAVEAYEASTGKLATPELTRILQDAVTRHPPPLVHGRSARLRYAHQGGQNPPLIVIHGNRTEHIPESYRRYLSNTYRKALKLWGTPVRIEFRGSDDPYRPGPPARRSTRRSTAPAKPDNARR